MILKKTVSIFFFAALSLFAFKSSAQNEKLINIIKQKFAYMNAHDSAKTASLYTDSATMDSPNFNKTEKGKKNIAHVYARYFSSSPDLVYTITRIIPADSVVTVEYISEATLSHPEEGTPSYMTNKKYTLQNCAVINISNNKIIKEVDYFDQLSFLRQVGFFDNH